MPSLTHYLTVLSAVAVGSAVADVNPNAQGACDDTHGGQDACGPNGSEAWLNTGLDGQGWNPPFLDINGLKHISLEDYYNGVGRSCRQYDQYFKSSGEKYNIDPAILAFLAMQESSCNADAGGPTPGLMQCEPLNCQNGKSSCQYPIQDNVDCGAHVLRAALDDAGGNAVRAIGSYNGWFIKGFGLNGGKGITVDYPCSAEGRRNGAPQNLDYLHETLNGWFQGLDVYGSDAGKVGGIYGCSGNCNNGDKC